MSAQADDKQQPTTNSISGIGESPTWRINSRSPDGLHSQSLSTRPCQRVRSLKLFMRNYIQLLKVTDWGLSWYFYGLSTLLSLVCYFYDVFERVLLVSAPSVANKGPLQLQGLATVELEPKSPAQQPTAVQVWSTARGETRGGGKNTNPPKEAGEMPK